MAMRARRFGAARRISTQMLRACSARCHFASDRRNAPGFAQLVFAIERAPALCHLEPSSETVQHHAAWTGRAPAVLRIDMALLLCSSFVLMLHMEHDSLWVAQNLLAAPAWARVALSAPKPQLREQAAVELAQAMIAALARPPVIHDPRQMSLPL
ncbi:hypothetical protein NYF14_05485 [Sphingobium sp. 10 DY56-G10]|uniref:DUF6771 family protein n=1 Tax=Sphingobium sp. 10 DY56-G10 TaxID=2974918 RepID=UPI00352B1366